MVLQLCGRVCRRLSFNPHHSFDEDFFCLLNFAFLGEILKDQEQKLGIKQKD
jgi:hypothetical protein